MDVRSLVKPKKTDLGFLNKTKTNKKTGAVHGLYRWGFHRKQDVFQRRTGSAVAGFASVGEGRRRLGLDRSGGSGGPRRGRSGRGGAALSGGPDGGGGGGRARRWSAGRGGGGYAGAGGGGSRERGGVGAELFIEGEGIETWRRGQGRRRRELEAVTAAAALSCWLGRPSGARG